MPGERSKRTCACGASGPALWVDSSPQARALPARLPPCHHLPRAGVSGYDMIAIPQSCCPGDMVATTMSLPAAPAWRPQHFVKAGSIALLGTAGLTGPER